MSKHLLAPPTSALDLPAGFHLPDWESPLDVESHLALVPEGCTAKGLFLRALLAEVERHGRSLPTRETYQGFHDYPLRHCLEQLVDGARLLYPGVPLRTGIRRLSWLAYDAFADSLIGRVIFGVLGRRVGAILGLAGRGVAHAANVGKVETEMLDEGEAILRAADVYAFLDCFGVGLVEAILRRCDAEGLVAVRMRSPTAGDLYVRWGQPQG